MKLVVDLHVHSISSGHAYSTLMEYVEQAKKIGLKGFALTDHGPAMPGAPHHYHFSNMRMIPQELSGIRIFRGIEANVINEKGDLDFFGDDFFWMDLVMVAMHPKCGYESQGIDKNTQVLLKALENPRINTIAHPGNPRYPLHVAEVVSAAKAKKVLIEINNSSSFSRPGSHDTCLQFAKEVKRQNWMVSIGTDSHIAPMLGDFTESLKLIKQAGLQEKNVINTSLRKVEAFLANRG